MSTTTTRTFPIVNPATGETVADVPDCGPDEARAAARLAADAFPVWRDRTAYDRAAVLKTWHALMLEHETVLAELMTKEMGKPITESRGEVKYAAAFVEWYAEEAKRVYGETVPSQFAHKRLLVRPQPVGPVYAVTPWNFPAAMITRKAAPALAAGCTVVREARGAVAAHGHRPGRAVGARPAVLPRCSRCSPRPIRPRSPRCSSTTRRSASSRSPAAPRSACCSRRRRRGP